MRVEIGQYHEGYKYEKKVEPSNSESNKSYNKTATDTLEISEDAKKLQKKSVNSKYKGIGISQEDGRYQISFMNPAYIHRVVKDGYIDVGNERVILSDEQKSELTATATDISNQMTQDTLDALFEHNMNVLEQQSEALSQQSSKDMEMMEILRRIIRGEKVSPAEERKLSEYNPEMYAMAKQASSVIQGDESTYAVNRNNDRESLEKDAGRVFYSPLKHLHEYTINMKTKIIDGKFNDIEIRIE